MTGVECENKSTVTEEKVVSRVLENNTTEQPSNIGEGSGDEKYYPEEEITEGNWNTPQVELKQVEVMTGEEDEEEFWKHRAKLYRFVNGEWKERGVGNAKLLQHKETKKIRFLLRQEKTFKIVANHYVIQKGSFCKLTPNSGSNKIWVWTVQDFSEDQKLEQFALKFGQVEQADIFKEKFEEAAIINMKLFDEYTKDDNEQEIDKLGKFKIDSSKSQEK
ncbi:Ran-binding protein, putative [Cryptosporidium muris RN66]|uniref:Ran-binding protein, putative n=1 Tax=Cryptosporidium muris (strain RN66) TaxID=441375 RepID=B6AAA6_CRYMR|nr:Ran-binding protein, putative [Cryptosporidium muris RN66]EEA05147.1 Ran-binding protein, putative [Cryptosporidium muris RN66]|eukprot:XP_002139496.1 Ran-binding protein [Cryptosporidium muris RN66]